MLTPSHQFFPIYFTRSCRYLLTRKCQHQRMVSQHQQLPLQVDQQSDDDFVETGKLTTEEFVDDEMHAGKRDETAQQGEVPSSYEDLHLDLLVDEVVIQVECQSFQLIQATLRDQVAHSQIFYQNFPETALPHQVFHHSQRLVARARMVYDCSCDEVHALDVSHLPVYPGIPHQHFPQDIYILRYLKGWTFWLCSWQIFLYLFQGIFPFLQASWQLLAWQFFIPDDVEPSIHPEALGLAIASSSLLFECAAEIFANTGIILLAIKRSN